MAGINTNRTTISLPAEVSREILQKTQEASAVMSLARQIPLPGRGAVIPVITSDPTAAWVAETDEKAVSNPGLSTKLMQAYQLAVIVPFSNQFRRDADALYNAIVERLPLALAQKFDATVIGAVNAPGENFDTFANATAQALVPGAGETVYGNMVAAYGDIAAQGGSMDGIAISPVGMSLLLGATGSDNRPIFNSAADAAIARILGARTVESRGMYKAGAAGVGTAAGTPALVGVAGDWTQAMWGTVGGVDISISEESTLTIGTQQINLWQRNMFAVRAEIEVGFRADTACFNLLTGATPNA
ncbi:MAG: phage major capsid protein [Oscillospiraceae bacterium]|nr:phage major capsid protein [Oscillospiraceae bacterium]